MKAVMELFVGKKVTVVLPYERLDRLITVGGKLYQPVKTLVYETRNGPLTGLLSVKHNLRFFTHLIYVGGGISSKAINLDNLEQDTFLRLSRKEVTKEEAIFCKLMERQLN